MSPPVDTEAAAPHPPVITMIDGSHVHVCARGSGVVLTIDGVPTLRMSPSDAGLLSTALRVLADHVEAHGRAQR